MLNHIAVIGLGSGGGAVADMLARAGVGKLTLVDPDKLETKNIQRHVLTHSHVIGDTEYKVFAMKRHLQSVSDCKVRRVKEKFDPAIFAPLIIHADPGGQSERSQKPDLVACCADSDACCQLVNQYCVDNSVPCVFAGVHGAAETAEVITFVPGKTPCYACYEREGPEPEPSQEKYTNPNYDPTKMPHQEGLWCDVLMAASIQFRAILKVMEVERRMVAANESRKKNIIYGCFGELWSDLNPLILASLRPPYGAEIIKQKPGCGVCSDVMEGLTI